MPYIRVLEVATFYTMFNLQPVGKHLVQVCTTTPCWLRGADDAAARSICHKRIGEQVDVTADGKFSWVEVECLGACVNAPMMQIDKDFYEDLDGPKSSARCSTRFAAARQPKPGPQIDAAVRPSRSAAPTTLTDKSIYAARARE